MKSPAKGRPRLTFADQPPCTAWSATRTSQRQGHIDSTLSTYAGSVGARSINAWPKRARKERNMITQEQIDAAWEVHGGGDAYEAFANGMRCGADLEREACAQVAEDSDHIAEVRHSYYAQLGDASATAQNIAAAIRARGANDGKPEEVPHG